MELIVDAQGVLRAVYDDALEFSELGAVEIRRVSAVEPTPAGWQADLAHVEGPILGPFPRRKEALAAEVAWVSDWLKGAEHA